MIVTGASAGPWVGESPMGISVLFTSACARPNTSRAKTQINIRCIMVDKKGDTMGIPFLLVVELRVSNRGYILPVAFIHLGYLFLASSRGTMPFTMIWNVPGLAKVLR